MLTSPGVKNCSTCKRTLPASEFYPHRRMKSGLQSNCRTCARAWHKARPEYVKEKNRQFDARRPNYKRDWARAVKYGVTVADVARLRSAQNGLCAGCGVSLTDAKECVDHCHTTGKVRGLLCNPCNVSLGLLRDNIASLRRLADYVEAHDLKGKTKCPAPA